MVETKLGLIDHLLADSAAIKEAVAKDADKTERRLDKLEELISQNHELKKRVPGLSPSALALAAQGHKKKDPETRHHRSVSFGMMSVSSDDRHEFNFGRDEIEFDEIKEWIGHFKSFPPALEPKYLNMMYAYHQHV